MTNTNSTSPSHPKRDQKGRWTKGGPSPNPKGRPKKKKYERHDPKDIAHFFGTVIEVKSQNGVERMTREEALLNKTFETAMKGGISAQRLLISRLDEKNDQIAEMQNLYQHLMRKYVIDNPDFTSVDEIPKQHILEIQKVYVYLHTYYPSSYPLEDMPFRISDEEQREINAWKRENLQTKED